MDEQLRTLAAKWLAATQDGQGVIVSHWRGAAYVDGRDEGLERCAADLLALLDRLTAEASA